MPFKLCKNCGSSAGPRTLVCKECNYSFPAKDQHNAMIAHVPPAIHAPASPVPQKVRSTYKAEIPRITLPLSDINLDPTGYFDDMIDRENQLSRTLRAARTAIESGFRITNHLLYYGAPSSGKTSFKDRFVRMVGDEYVYEIDATTSTQAGIIDDLQTRGEIKFILLSEFDKLKGNGDEFKWLLSGMDEKKKIRKLTANGPIEIKTEALFIADCNNLGRIERLMDGALYSRFVNKVYFPSISDDDIRIALQRYNRMVHGNDEWIPHVIDYVRRTMGMADMRTMIGLLTDGKDGWLDGTYEKELEASSF
jgi:hypothetical protein